MTTIQPPEMLSVRQVAERLNLSTRAVQRKIASGELAAIRIGEGKTSAWAVPATSLPVESK